MSATAVLTDDSPAARTAVDCAIQEVSGNKLAPADLEPAPRWWQRLLWYSGALLITALLLTGGMQLWKRDLHAPFFYDLDALLYLPMAKSIIETGTHWRTERLGAPGIQEMHDFPVIDYLHFAFIWLLGQYFQELLLAYNFYSFLAYPLSTLTAMWVMRWLKLSCPTAALGGVLYAFLPYHQERFHYHYFLAAYWWVPVSLVPAIALCQGEFPYFRRGLDGRYPEVAIDWRNTWSIVRSAFRASRAAWRQIAAWCGLATVWLTRNFFTRASLVPVAIGIVTASAGAYYAFFACATYAFAGLYAWVVHRTWRGAVSALLVIAPVVVTGVVFHLPTVIYQLKYGRNTITQREPHEADAYGLKLAHLLLPTIDHNVRPLASIRLMYATPMRLSDDESAGALGVIGTAGMLAMFTIALLPYRRGWPEGPVISLTLFLVLLATIGGFGSLYNLLFSAQIRAYNRISVFIAFFCIFMALWWVDRFLLTRRGNTMRKLRYPILIGLLFVGYIDQTPWGWNPFNPRHMSSVDAHAERFRADQRYFKEIEKTMPPGSMIFCLPHAPFPEHPPINKMAIYEHARGYIFTNTLRWSHGAIKGREVDMWQRDVADLIYREPEKMLERIVARGFDGLHIDGRGFPAARDANRAAVLIRRINDRYQAAVNMPGARLPQIDHEDGKQFFLDLRPFRAAWETTPQFKAQERYEHEWVATLWLNGFMVTFPPDEGERVIWGTTDVKIWFVNPTDRVRRFKVSFLIGVDSEGTFDFTMSGLIADSFSLDRLQGREEADVRRYGVPKEYEFELPPGRAYIRIRTRTPDHYALPDRGLWFYMKGFTLTEQ